MNTKYTAKKGTTGKTMYATLRDADGDPIDLTGCTVNLIVTPKGGMRRIIEANMTLIPESAGRCSYTFEPGDLDHAAGVYDMEIVLADGSGDIEKFPAIASAPFGELVIVKSK